MKVIEIKNIERKDNAVHYRRSFAGDAVLEHIGGPTEPRRIEFVLEQSPLGSTEVRVEIRDSLNYPLVPAVRVLVDHIRVLDKQGKLP
jgi:hypothetical protein